MESNRARVAVLLTAAAAVVVLFLVLSSGDEESAETTTSASATTTTTPDDDKGKGRAKHANHPNRQKGNGGGQDEPALPTVILRGGEPIGPPLEISVKSGDEVRFIVDSDTDNEIHVHGYEIYEDIAPGENEISFTADLEGAYEIETHVAPETLIAELEVNPG